MNLAEAVQGQSVEIVKVGGAGAIRQRLLDMGVTRGTIVTVERYAPLQDPIHIKVKGYSLALRVAEGKVIEVVEVK